MKSKEVLENIAGYSTERLSSVTVEDRSYGYDKNIRGEYMLGLTFSNSPAYVAERLALNAQDARAAFARPMPLIARSSILANIPNLLLIDYSIDSQTKISASAHANLTTRKALEIARDHVKDEFGSRALEHAIYIAHPVHMQRVEEIAKKLGFNGTPFLDLGLDAPEKWRRYELMKRLHHKARTFILKPIGMFKNTPSGYQLWQRQKK